VFAVLVLIIREEAIFYDGSLLFAVTLGLGCPTPEPIMSTFVVYQAITPAYRIFGKGNNCHVQNKKC